MRSVFIVAAVVLPLAACGGSPAPGAGAASAANGASPASDFVVPTAQLAHVGIVPVTKTAWATTLTTTGTVDWDNDHTTQVITQISGPVTRILVDTGAQVKTGDPLMYVASPDVTNAVSAYRKAENRLDLAQRTLDRSKDLLDHKAIAPRDMESVQADYNDASTDVQNALEALEIFGVAPADLADAQHQNVPIHPELAVRAPLSGTVVQRLVLPGQVIQAGTTIAFVISDTSHVWIQGHIYERDLPRVHVGDAVDATNSALPGTFHGTVTFIDRVVDPATRTTLVRIVTPNTGGALKKDLFLDLAIHDRARRDVLSVPVGAVLYNEQNLPFVYVQVGSGRFAQRLVRTGAQQDDRVEIVDGLKEGDQVVGQGSVFLQFANTFGQ